MGKRVDLYLPESYLVRNGLMQAPFLSVPLNSVAHHLGGRTVKPEAPVEIVGPDGKTPIILIGAGVTEAAELEDMAQAAYEKEEQRLKRDGHVFGRAHEVRADNGFWPLEDFDTQFRQALRDRVAKHKANPRTDPPRLPGRME